jgi:integrase/recombinase XerD
LALAVVRDLREHRLPVSEEDLADFETDVLAGFVLARASAGLTDSTIRNDTNHLELIRDWFGRPLWEMQPADADSYFGKVLRDEAVDADRPGGGVDGVLPVPGVAPQGRAAQVDRSSRRGARSTRSTGRGPWLTRLRIPPTEPEIEPLFAGWRDELATCRKFAPAARNYAVARLASDVGLRINEIRMLDLDDVRWKLNRFGKLNIRHGKGSRRKGPKPRLVPLINGADELLRWFIEDVLNQFGTEHTRHGAPLFPSEHRNTDGSCCRATSDVFRRSLAEAAICRPGQASSRRTCCGTTAPPSSISPG